MIRLEKVTKKFGEKTVVDEVSLNIDKGNVVGLVGPNGAGKTTTMRLIIGYLSRTSGTIMIDGHDPQESGWQIRKKIGYLPENNPLYYDLKTSEYLDFIANIKGTSKKDKKKGIEKIVEICGLSEVYQRIIGELSRGFKQRVGVGAALLGDPSILILDEPTSGLDPNQIMEIRKLIKELGKEKTIILSTHIIPEVSQTCNRIVVINKGKIAADKKVDDFGGETEFCKLTKEEQI